MTFFQRRLEAFPRLADYRLAKAAGYWPYYKTVESASRPRFMIEGNEYINFGSNNYLSLSYHPEVIEAAQRATSKYGTGVTGSVGATYVATTVDEEARPRMTKLLTRWGLSMVVIGPVVLTLVLILPGMAFS